MGKDHDPWQNNAGTPALAKQSTNLMMFSNCANPYGFHRLNSTAMLQSNPAGFSSGQKTFMVFDQTGDRRSLMFSSLGAQLPSPIMIPAGNAGLGSDICVSKEINVSKEEMHEDTEEIDALLYSDSDNDYNEEDEASTGHSPITGNFEDGEEEEEVASSVVVEVIPRPTKRRRIHPELDPLLADTASSNNSVGHRKKVKCERIHETVGVLREIIPGGKGKDAVSVLDEAIQYLKSLRLKAKEKFGSSALK